MQIWAAGTVVKMEAVWTGPQFPGGLEAGHHADLAPLGQREAPGPGKSWAAARTTKAQGDRSR